MCVCGVCVCVCAHARLCGHGAFMRKPAARILDNPGGFQQTADSFATHEDM